MSIKMNEEARNQVFDRRTMLSAIEDFEVESAKKVNFVCHYLEAFQMSPQAWTICSDMLWELDEHSINVLFMCGTMLRQKIRAQIHLLSDEAQGQLRDTLVQQVKNAVKSGRKGIESIMRLIALIIAEMGLRMRDWPFMVCNVIAELWLCAPQALFEIFQVLPELPEGEELEQHMQLLRYQSDTVLQLLTNFPNRTDMDSISIGRGCLLCYGAWAHKGLLPLETVLEHVVVLQAIALLEQPELMERQLYAEACICFVGVINCVRNNPLGCDPGVMQKMRKDIFGIVNGFIGNFNKLSPEEKDDCAEIFRKLTEVFAGIRNADKFNDSLILWGPLCFQLQLKVTEQCSMITVLDNLHVWHQLAWHLKHRYELELYHLYQPLVEKFILELYPKCRLTEPSDVRRELLSNLRSQFRELVRKFADLLELNAIMPDQLKQICNPLSSESDLEMALFFVGPLVEFLNDHLPHIVEELMYCLHSLYARTLLCSLPVHQQLIFCLTNCHLVKNKPNLRHEFVEHLSNLCNISNDRMLVIAALEAFNVLAYLYADVAELEQLFKTLRINSILPL